MDENDQAFIIQEQLNSNLVGGLFLVLSNLFIVPAIIESLYAREEDSAIVYFNILIASSLYHSCRAGFVCVIAYIDHRKLDYLFVYFAVMWTLTTGLGKSHTIPYRIRLVVFNFFFLPMAILIIGNYEGHAVQIVGGLLPGISMYIIAKHYGVPLFRRWGWALAAIVLGGIAGLFMFAMPYNTYEWSHSVWHIFAMLALLCLKKSTRRRFDVVNPFDDPELYRRPLHVPLIRTQLQ